METCQNCGRSLDLGDSYCRGCGGVIANQQPGLVPAETGLNPTMAAAIMQLQLQAERAIAANQAQMQQLVGDLTIRVHAQQLQLFEPHLAYLSGHGAFFSQIPGGNITFLKLSRDLDVLHGTISELLELQAKPPEPPQLPPEPESGFHYFLRTGQIKRK